MTLARQNRAPSTLIDILQQCKDALDAMGAFMPTSVGKTYLSTGPGSFPRVIFVPESGRGKIGPPHEFGNAASVTHTCEVHVRAMESGDDVARFRAAYALGDLVIDLVQTAATGRVEWGSYTDGSPTDTDAYGAEVVISFSYKRDVPHSAIRWGLAQALADTSEPQPVPPPGTPAGGITIDPTTTPNPDP